MIINQYLNRIMDILKNQNSDSRRLILIMAGVMLGLFMAALDQTIVSTAMPRIVAELGGLEHFTWITSSYLVASTTAVPVVGGLTDIYGRKKFYIVGLSTFLSGSILAGQSQTMEQLIAIRALQGVGGGVLMTLAFITVGDLFSASDRGKYQGIVAGVFGLSSVVGPTLGGFITESLSWHWIFYINIPLSIPVIIILTKYLPDVRVKTHNPQLDWIGIVTLTLSIIPLMIALSWGGSSYGWGSPLIMGMLVISVIMAVVFVFTELRVKNPIMPMGIYGNSIVSISFIASFFIGFGMFGGITFIPLFFQGVLGVSPSASGSFLTPMMLSMVIGAAIGGQALSRIGGHYRIQGLIAIGFMTIGVFLVSRMTSDTSQHSVIFNIILFGFGLGNTFPVFTIAVQNATPRSFLGVSTSAIQFYRSIGGAIGLALLGSHLANRFYSKLGSDLSTNLSNSITTEQIKILSNNPEALMNHDPVKWIIGSFQISRGTASEIIASMKTALASGITDVFLIITFVSIAAFIVTIFLKETRTSKNRV